MSSPSESVSPRRSSSSGPTGVSAGAVVTSQSSTIATESLSNVIKSPTARILSPSNKLMMSSKNSSDSTVAFSSPRSPSVLLVAHLLLQLPSDFSSYVLSFLPLRDLVNLMLVSKKFKDICDSEKGWTVRLRSRYPNDVNLKPQGTLYKQFYIQKHTRTFGPVIEMLQRFAPFRILTQGMIQNSVNQIIHPPEEISGVLRQSSRLRKLFRERQQIVGHLLQLNANLHKLPGIFAQCLMVIVCESVMPEFFNYPYLGFSLNRMFNWSYFMIMALSIVVLGVFPSVLSIINEPGGMIQSNDVYRWILFDELMYRIIKEVCLRWISLCMIMVAAITIDVLFAYVHPCLMVYYTVRDLFRGLHNAGISARLIVHCFANVILIVVVWDIHWVFELCSALGIVFHWITFQLHENVMIGPDWSQRLFSFAILMTFLLPDTYYYRKIANVDEMQSQRILSPVRLSGWLLSFLDSQLMLFVTLHFGLIPTLIVAMITGFFSVTAQYATAQVVKKIDFCPARLRDPPDDANDGTDV
eukprot:TRINITY_DN40880_c0_g1_i1.p1 TRINITY_DN40880_c0_g1~~TRINITY_DN40880_c0_g1_i1.p1  ORF type:complete len:526 (+),score=119.16 TRINITY_DN40880_c0_g1_i1:115-1692(+)